jgi:hypothetical protein
MEWRTILRIFRYPIPTAAIALSLLVGFCGGGVIFSVEASASSTATTLGTSSPAMSRTEALALARSEILPGSAYPVGWKRYGPNTEFKGLSYFALAGFYEHNAALLASCLQIPTTNIQTNPVEIAGPRYNGRNSDLAMSENLEVFRSAVTAAIDTQAAGNARTPVCNRNLPGSQTGSEKVNGVTIDVTEPATTVLPIKNYAENTAGLEISTLDTVPEDKTAFRAYSDFAYIQKGRSEAVLFFSNVKAPVPSDFIAEMAQKAANRLAPQ